MPFPHAASIARRTAALLLAALPAPAAELIDPAALGFGSPAFTLDTTFQDSLSLENGSGDLTSSKSAPSSLPSNGSTIHGSSPQASTTQASKPTSPASPSPPPAPHP